MTAVMEGVQTKLVPMVPDDSVRWERTDVDSLGGSIYTSPGCPDHIVDRVLMFNRPASAREPGLLPFDEGKFAHVYSVDDVAYKVHKPAKTHYLYGASELAANIALSEGLRRLNDQGDLPALDYDGSAVSFSAPEYYAALVPQHPWLRTTTPSRFVIAMSLESGTIPIAGEVPAATDRAQRYRAALEKCKLAAENVFLDDSCNGGPTNTLVQHDRDTRTMNIVKLDVMAGYDYARSWMEL